MTDPAAPTTDQVTVTVEPTEYTVCAVPQDVQDWYLFAIIVARTAPDRWAVRMRSRCLDADGAWDYESIPSERTDEWLAAHRFDLPTALDLARAAALAVTVNGWTVQRVIAEWHREAP